MLENEININESVKVELLMRNTEEPFVLVGRDLKIITFNEEFKYQYFKYFSVQVAKGVSILSYASSERTEYLKEVYKKAFQGIRTESELTIPVTSKISHTVLIKYKPALDEGGKIFGVFVSILDITEKKQAIESHNRFQALIENAREIITLADEDGKIIYISPSVSVITGYSVAELKDPTTFNKMHPDYQRDSKKILEEAFKNPGVPIYRLNRLLHKNGSIIWLEGSIINLLHDTNIKAVLSNFRDITERKNAEERLKESENNLRTIFDNIEEGIILLDDKCIIKAFNSKADENNMITAKDLEIGESLMDYIKPERVSFFKDCIHKILNGESVEYDIDYKQNDGIQKWFHATLKPVKENNVIKGICIARRDITKRKNSEEELKAGELKYKLLSEELAASNAELEQFAYMTSHDLQEPLRMVTGFLNQLELKYKDELDEKARQYIFFATDGATRMRKIILDLLEYSLAGKKALETETVNVDELLSESLQLNRKIIEEKNADITWNNLPAVQANRSSLQQVFHNLLGNALKYQKPGQKPIIQINATETDTHWNFSFSDNGIGIEEEFYERIFVVFQRLHNRSEYNGTGLGLAICKKIVENHSGKIWVNALPGKGSTFYFTILKTHN